MAIGLQQGPYDVKNLVNLRDIFMLEVVLVDRNFRFTPVRYEPCNRSMWNMFNDSKYNTLRLDTFLCINKEGVEIYGENGSPDVNFIVINLSECTNASSPVPCKPIADINSYLTNNMSWNRFFALSFVILNTGINPTSAQPYIYNAY